MLLLQIIFFLLCNIILLVEKKFKFLGFCVPCALFEGQNLDIFYLVVLKLGVRDVMFSSEGADVSEIDYLSWLSSTISSELWAFGVVLVT